MEILITIVIFAFIAFIAKIFFTNSVNKRKNENIIPNTNNSNWDNDYNDEENSGTVYCDEKNN